MLRFFSLLFGLIAARPKSRARLEAEILVLSHQLGILRRQMPKHLARNGLDRLLFVWIYWVFPSVVRAVAVIRPETIMRWHRAGFRSCWRWRSRPRWGRPKALLVLRRFIREMSLDNPLWGCPCRKFSLPRQSLNSPCDQLSGLYVYGPLILSFVRTFAPIVADGINGSHNRCRQRDDRIQSNRSDVRKHGRRVLLRCSTATWWRSAITSMISAVRARNSARAAPTASRSDLHMWVRLFLNDQNRPRITSDQVLRRDSVRAISTANTGESLRGAIAQAYQGE